MIDDDYIIIVYELPLNTEANELLDRLMYMGFDATIWEGEYLLIGANIGTHDLPSYMFQSAN